MKTVPYTVIVILGAIGIWLFVRLQKESERTQTAVGTAWGQLILSRQICNESLKLREGGTGEFPDDALLNAYRKTLFLQADFLAKWYDLDKDMVNEFKAGIILPKAPPASPLEPEGLPRGKVVLPP